jgi:pheromone shutdown protein TraB
VIKNETPDCVCVELDLKRYETMLKKRHWESTDLKKIIRQRQLTILLFNLILASYQKKMGDQIGILPGTEMLAAVRTAKEKNIPIALCDRDVRVTLRRAWHASSFFK